ncbi:MAG: sulfatase-like hydrolase/transferase [Alphaproteobacteria bacterium]|nr:sulfatase-like hydrolase/transferase [Alphaproteobacteria bacterium]
MGKRPNFVLFITDQHRVDHLGCYGNEIVRTPNIDGLAARGTKFENFHVSCPICMPNRATLMTGRVPSLHGVRQNGIPLSLQAVTFPELLRSAGYRTALIGKSHLQSISAIPLEHGLPTPDPGKALPPAEAREARRNVWGDGRYDQEQPTTWRGEEGFEPALPFYGFDELALAIGHGDRITGHYDRWLRARHPDADTLRGPDNALPPGKDIWAPQAWRTAVPEELYPTSFVAEETIAFLERRARADDVAPFFIQCSFPDPHHPFTPPGKYFDMYDPADVPAPDAFHHPANRLPPHVAALHAKRDDGTATKKGQTVFACTEREARGAIALNYGSITMIDDAVGRVLATLDRLGMREDTVIVFTSDHGDFMGDHQLLLKGAIHYRGLVRVPCIWSDPAAPDAPTVTDAFAGTIDLPTSFLDRAGINPFNGMQGKSLPALATGAEAHDSLVIEEDQRRSYMGFPANFRARTLLAGDWRLTLYSCTEWGELYNLKNDPLEFENLWTDPKQRAVRAELMERLARKMIDLAESSPLATGHGP